MPKELVTNISSVVSDGIKDIIASNSEIGSVITLYDCKKSNKYIACGETCELIDSINNYDFLIIESAGWSGSQLFINPHCIPKPLIKNGVDINNIPMDRYMLDVYYNTSSLKRVDVTFPTDTSIKVTLGINSGGSYNLGVRNIYGIKIKTPMLPTYSTEEAPVAVWIDGRTVYRKFIDNIDLYGVDETSVDVSLLMIDDIVQVNGTIVNTLDRAIFPLPQQMLTTTGYWYLDSSHNNIILKTKEYRNHTIRLIIDYVKR